MWLKLLGAICIVVACGDGGTIAARRLQQRVALLYQLDQGLALLASQIDYGGTPLAQGFQETAAASEGQAALLFRQAAQGLSQNQGLTAQDAWEQALAALEWDPADQEVLRRLGQGLGLSGREDQLKRLETARRLLAENRRVAAEDAAGYGKIWRSLGWGGGLVLALFFL